MANRNDENNRQDAKHAKNAREVAAEWRDTSVFDWTSFLMQLGVLGVLAVQFSEFGNTQLPQYLNLV